MKYRHLSKQELKRAIVETSAAAKDVKKYEDFLATGKGLPKNLAARIELMTSNVKLLAKLQAQLQHLISALAAKHK